MTKNRLEAFTDAVLAIIMTILVLELPKPEGANFHALFDLKEQIMIYVISFVILIIYWNNHHHIFQLVNKVDSKILWMNNLFIFSLSLFPFFTDWVGNYLFEFAPQLSYALLILSADFFYFLMTKAILKKHKGDKKVETALNDYKKTCITLTLNVIAVLLAFVLPILSLITNVLMIIMWIIPEKRIENVMDGKN